MKPGTVVDLTGRRCPGGTEDAAPTTQGCEYPKQIFLPGVSSPPGNSFTIWPLREVLQPVVDGLNRQDGTRTVDVKTRLPGPDERTHSLRKGCRKYPTDFFVFGPLVKRSSRSFENRASMITLHSAHGRRPTSTKFGLSSKLSQLGYPGPSIPPFSSSNPLAPVFLKSPSLLSPVFAQMYAVSVYMAWYYGAVSAQPD